MLRSISQSGWQLPFLDNAQHRHGGFPELPLGRTPFRYEPVSPLPFSLFNLFRLHIRGLLASIFYPALLLAYTFPQHQQNVHSESQLQKPRQNALVLVLARQVAVYRPRRGSNDRD